MELRHLRYVVAVAETLHFGQAAERLNISQPPLSQQIRQLEDELGVRLFHRTKRHVTLTPAGELFVQEARMVLAQAEHAGKVAERVGHGEDGQIVVGVAGPADADYFVAIIRAFAKRHPGVSISIRNMNTPQQLEALHEKRLHVGFVALPIDAPQLTTQTVLHQPVVVALPRKHRLAARARVGIQALASEPHIMFARALGPGFFDAIVGACRSAGFNLNVVHEVDNLQSACGLVASGLGVCLLPAGLLAVRSKAVVLRPLTPALPKMDCELALAYRSDLLCDLVSRFVSVVNDVQRKGRKRQRSV